MRRSYTGRLTVASGYHFDDHGNLINEATGEIAGRPPEPKSKTWRSKDRDPFTKLMHHPAVDELINEATGAELRVLWYLAKEMDFGVCFRLHRAEIARAVGLSHPGVTKACNALTERGVLCQDVFDPDCWWLSNDVARRGQQAEYNIVRSRARCCGRPKRLRRS